MSTFTPLDSSRIRFSRLIKLHPIFARYWNEDRGELEYQLMKEGLKGLSHGEKIMGAFFLSVWCDDNEGFDFLEAAGKLDLENKRIVMTWFTDPFWP